MAGEGSGCSRGSPAPPAPARFQRESPSLRRGEMAEACGGRRPPHPGPGPRPAASPGAAAQPRARPPGPVPARGPPPRSAPQPAERPRPLPPAPHHRSPQHAARPGRTVPPPPPPPLYRRPREAARPPPRPRGRRGPGRRWAGRAGPGGLGCPRRLSGGSGRAGGETAGGGSGPGPGFWGPPPQACGRAAAAEPRPRRLPGPAWPSLASNSAFLPPQKPGSGGLTGQDRPVCGLAPQHLFVLAGWVRFFYF